MDYHFASKKMGVVRGDVPPAFGWTLPTNDLLWWIPFACILIHAWRAQRPTGLSHRDA